MYAEIRVGTCVDTGAPVHRDKNIHVCRNVHVWAHGFVCSLMHGHVYRPMYRLLNIPGRDQTVRVDTILSYAQHVCTWHVYTHVHTHVCRHALVMCYTPLEGSRRYDSQEYQRVIPMNSDMLRNARRLPTFLIRIRRSEGTPISCTQATHYPSLPPIFSA